MLINEKIRFMRQQKGWSQEEMAHRLSMSPNGYGNIERGNTNINMIKLKKIAALLDENLLGLFGVQTVVAVPVILPFMVFQKHPRHHLPIPVAAK